MAYPIEYCATHGIWCALTGCIGLDVVPTALDGSTDAGSSVQPYIVTYMWKRTA